MGSLKLTPQTLSQYPSISENMWPGMPIRADIVRRRLSSATLGNTPFTNEIWEVQIGYNADGDNFGITINGATYVAVASVDSETSAQIWITVHGQSLVDGEILESVPTTDGSGLIFLTFADGLSPTVVGYAPDGTTVSVTLTRPGDGPDLFVTWGMGVIASPERVDPNVDIIARRPKTAEEVTKYFSRGGVVNWAPRSTEAERLSLGFSSDVDIALTDTFLLYRKNSFENPFVHYATSATAAVAQPGDPAFLVFDQKSPDWGKFRSDNGGTSQVIELTFAGANGAGLASGNFDGLFDIAINDTASDADNALAWMNAAEGNAVYAILAEYTNAGVLVRVFFNDTETHVFTDTSVNGITITAVTTQAAVAAIAADTGLLFAEGSVAARAGIQRAGLDMNS